MNAYLGVSDWKRAVRMWRAGKDTKDIASVLGVPEAVIYNRLWAWRKQFENQTLAVSA